MRHAVAEGLFPLGDRNGSRTQPGVRPRGEKSAVAKLNEATVRQIRADHGSGESLSSIARRIGVCVQSIHNVVNRATWRHVP